MTVWKLAACIPLVLAGSLAQAAPDAVEAQEILKKNACMACHAVDKKVLGPALNQVAEHHKNEENLAELLTQHIRNGSSGVWGPVPMPPNPGISDEDLAKVVEWVVAGAPQ